VSPNLLKEIYDAKFLYQGLLIWAVSLETPRIKVIFSKTGNSKCYCSFSYDRVYFYCWQWDAL